MISEQSQYQSPIDAPHGQAHPSVMQSQHESSSLEGPLVSIVDDDESLRESLPDLLREFGFTTRAFSSAEGFLSSDCIEQTRCLILDIAMPGMSGPELQEELRLRRREIPIVFITGQGNETIRARVLEQGAVGFLLKPFTDTALLDAISAVLRAN